MTKVCYMFVVGMVTDMDRFMATYQAAVEPLIPKFGGRYLLRGGPTHLLEGDFGANGGMVLSEWPSKEAALRFWNSPEYAKAKTLREGLGRFQVILIESEPISA